MKFKVEITETNVYVIDVEESDKIEAKAKAWELLIQMDEREKEEHFSEGDASVRIIG